jgi:hypothetical protein
LGNGGFLTNAIATPNSRDAVSDSPRPSSGAFASAAVCLLPGGPAALFQGAGDAELATVQQSCQRGDIIAISTAAQGSVFQIGRLCDFSKAIVNAGGQVLCALSSTRGVR